MADLNRVTLRRLAVKGAMARLSELKAEEAALRRAFPELSRAAQRSEERSSAEAGATASAGRRRGRRRMSAAQRKAVSDRMKKYWAERRKAKR